MRLRSFALPLLRSGSRGCMAAPYRKPNSTDLPLFTSTYKRRRRLLAAFSRPKQPFPLKRPLGALIAISDEMAF